ncbi:hypothetical protein [Radiobacillus deserti]|uniref:Flagellar hook-length control protein FliK n=1 Tax=Radiobacillus deserti TaxID=2594883 RepID=A0A516KFK8_9BACI|nr:hypothetical protein [Radiobacillus deserti]QDP40160.1 hypothetical protein FN924_08255 [Radiobacillus deserti]
MTSIYSSITSLVHKSNNQNGVLIPGQVIRGKVLKLFANQQALIQLGNQQLVAQLQTPLASADSYWFQVQSTGDSIHLKVLSDKKALTEGQIITQLIQSLGLKDQKAGQALLMQLLRDNIPFTPKDIKAAFDILKHSPDKKAALDTLVSLFSSRIPISPATFEAFSTDSKQSFTKQIDMLYQSLRETGPLSNEQTKLLAMLESVRSNTNQSFVSYVTQRIKQEITTNNPMMYNLFQKAGLLDSHVSWEQWKVEWSKPMGENSLALSSSLDQVKLKLQELYANQLPLTSNQKQQLVTLIQRLDGNGTRTDAQLAVLEKFLDKFQIKPVFSSIENRLAGNQSVSGQEWNRVQLLQTLSNLQLDTTSSKGLVDVVTKMPVSSDSSSLHFLAHIKQAIRLLGLDYEQQVVHLAKQNGLEHADLDSSIKSLLIELVQQEKGTNPTSQSRFEPLLQLITNAQLVSNHQLGPYIQLNVQLPGSTLGVKDDINLTFEGQKTASGEINPDFCRILFYLQLHQLEETIIDMNVQKRNVHVTIYNDHPMTEKLVNQFKDALHHGLDSLQYQLSTIHVKTLPTDEGKKDFQATTPIEVMNRKGVDFKI